MDVRAGPSLALTEENKSPLSWRSQINNESAHAKALTPVPPPPPTTLLSLKRWRSSFIIEGFVYGGDGCVWCRCFLKHHPSRACVDWLSAIPPPGSAMQLAQGFPNATLFCKRILSVTPHPTPIPPPGPSGLEENPGQAIIKVSNWAPS